MAWATFFLQYSSCSVALPVRPSCVVLSFSDAQSGVVFGSSRMTGHRTVPSTKIVAELPICCHAGRIRQACRSNSELHCRNPRRRPDRPFGKPLSKHPFAFWRAGRLVERACYDLLQTFYLRHPAACAVVQEELLWQALLCPK